MIRTAAQTRPYTPAGGRWRTPAVFLAVGSFAMGTDSFVLAGILPQLAGGLRVTEGQAGQVVTVFALTYAVAAPVLASICARMPRKLLLILALAVFVAANLGSAAAPTLPLLFAARVVAGLGAAAYTPTASAAAAALAGPTRRGQALGIILGGLTVGTVFGVPVGTALGQQVSWQASLVFVAAVAALALLGVLIRIPALPVPPAVPMRDRIAVLANNRLLAWVAVMTIASGASILVYTYIAPVLAAVTHLTGPALTVALLAWGVGGSLGAFSSGWLTDRYGAGRTLTMAIALLGVTLLGLGYAAPPAAAYPLLIVNGAAAWAVATPNNHRLTDLVPELPSVVISYNSTGIYLGQALGAGIGGVLLARTNPTALCVTAACAAMAGLLLHLATAGQRPTATGPAAVGR